MNKQDLKQILRPLIKECVKEVIFEEGSLSTIIKEVLKGTGEVVIKEQKPHKPAKQQPQKTENNRLREHKKRLLDSIGSEAYNGVNLFEGTQALSTAAGGGGSSNGPLSGHHPSDPGVDISNLMEKTSKIWKKMEGN